MVDPIRPKSELGGPAEAVAADRARAAEQSRVEGPRSLLPEPKLRPELDALSTLYALIGKDRAGGKKSSLVELRRAHEQREKFWVRVQAQLDKAIEASKKGGLWGNLGGVLGKVAAVTTVVASVAAVVATAGAATPIAAVVIAGAVMSAAAVAQTQFHYLEAAGLDPKAASFVTFGMFALGALGTGAAGFAGAAGADKSVLLFCRVAGGVNGGAQVATGAATIESGVYHREAEQHRANAAGARIEIELQNRQIQLILDAIEQTEEHDHRTIETLSGTVEAKDQTSLLIARA